MNGIEGIGEKRKKNSCVAKILISSIYANGSKLKEKKAEQK